MFGGSLGNRALWVLGLWTALAAGACRSQLYEESSDGPVSYELKDRGWGQARQRRRRALTEEEIVESEERAKEYLTEAREESDSEDKEKLAVKAYEAAQSEDTAKNALFIAASAAFESQFYRRSVKRFQAFLTTFPGDNRYLEIVDKLFESGKLALENGSKDGVFNLLGDDDRTFALKTLENFIATYDRHPKAPEAIFIIGEDQLKSGEPSAAAVTFQRLIDSYPDSKREQLARLRLAQAYIASADGFERDQVPLLRALSILRGYIRRFPKGDVIQEVRAELTKLEEGLARQDMEVALYYKKVDKPRGFQNYLEHIVREYPRSDTGQEAKAILQELENQLLPGEDSGN